jgi:hypothetical protein
LEANPISDKSRWLPVLWQWRNVDQFIFHGPIQNALEGGNRILDSRGAVVSLPHLLLDLGQMELPQFGNSNRRPDDLQRTEDSVAETVVGCWLLAGLNVVQVLVAYACWTRVSSVDSHRK